MEGSSDTWRHELKFVCQEHQLKIVESRISRLMAKDPHTDADGRYRISSLYLDDMYDTCLQENAAGTDPREKFRIRIYGGSSERIMLELKQKSHSLARKLSCPLTKGQCLWVMEGKPLPVDDRMPPLLQKFGMQQRTRGLRAKVIVNYERVPYVYGPGNVRITFDRYISASQETDSFLSQEKKRLAFIRPVLPTGQQVLEVKYDAFLPDPVRQLLQLGTLQRTSFSKYEYCRANRIR